MTETIPSFNTFLAWEGDVRKKEVDKRRAAL
jgi:hypothetical protein